MIKCHQAYRGFLKGLAASEKLRREQFTSKRCKGRCWGFAVTHSNRFHRNLAQAQAAFNVLLRSALAAGVGIEVDGQKVGAIFDGGLVSFAVGLESADSFPFAYKGAEAVGKISGLFADMVYLHVWRFGLEEFQGHGIDATEFTKDETIAVIDSQFR
jgi:hypothetical protein